jgi:processing peptidase subunit alpha
MSVPTVMKSPIAKQISKSIGVDLHRATENVLNLTGRSRYREFNLIGPHPDAPKAEDIIYDDVETKVEKLANGVTVVTRNTQEAVGVVGVYIDAGSRHGNMDSSGIPHFMESIALEATDHRTALNLSSGLQNAGASFICNASRDGLIYQCELFGKDADLGLGMIKEIIREPALEYWKFKEYHKEYLWRRGDDMGNAEKIMPELMHQAAWAGNTLGLPMFGDEFTVPNYKPEVIREFIDTFVTPSRVIVGAVGVDHNEAMELADAYWGDLEEGVHVPTAKAHYKGESIKKPMKLEDEFAHVALVFNTENWHSSDLMAMCTLNMMMGGGGHFSAGGPGKGMYTRIYQEVLGRYSWLNGLHCSHSIYDDSGIFAYYGTCTPQYNKELLYVMAEQASNAANRTVTQEELDRAKTALATNICFDFEDRQVVFEDICRQIKVYGEHKTPDMWLDQIQKVTGEDVRRVAQKMLSCKPTVVAIGPTDPCGLVAPTF